MTPNEIFALPPVDDSPCADPYHLYVVRQAFPELFEGDLFSLPNTRVRVLAHAYKRYDFRRGWLLGSLWFDEHPFAVVQRAGRELDDFYRTFVTDLARRTEAVQYLRSISATDDDRLSVIEPTVPLDGLTDFYNDHL